eukprot:COSAG01_NODE_12265_length_1770_cov_1.334530_3_plen_209_part_00
MIICAQFVDGVRKKRRARAFLQRLRNQGVARAFYGLVRGNELAKEKRQKLFVARVFYTGKAWRAWWAALAMLRRQKLAEQMCRRLMHQTLFKVLMAFRHLVWLKADKTGKEELAQVLLRKLRHQAVHKCLRQWEDLWQMGRKRMLAQEALSRLVNRRLHMCFDAFAERVAWAAHRRALESRADEMLRRLANSAVVASWNRIGSWWETF